MNTSTAKSINATATSLLLLLTGCVANPAVLSSVTVATGRITGGQQPVAGAHIYLLGAGQTGIQSPASSLLVSGTADSNGRYYVTSDANGGFTLTGAYAPCADATVPVFALAVGGNPGLSAGTNNAALSLMASLGPCGSLTATRFLNINELTTVGFATAFAPYTADAWHIGAAANQGLALADASATAAALVDTGNGAARQTIGNSALPFATVNTLGDILAPCVNSAGGASSQCVSLYAAATPSGGGAPADTLSAALSIAQNPASQVAALFGLSNANAPFQPALVAAPADFTLGPQIPASFTTVAGVVELGDSITTILNGNGATPVQNGYGQLLANDLGGALNYGVGPSSNDYSQGGDEAIDTAFKAWAYSGPLASGNPPITLMIGTNDVNFEDASATNANHQQVYRENLMAAMSLYLTPQTGKLFPYNNAACSGAGWTADGSLPSSANGLGVFTSVTGSPYTCTFTTLGAPIYLWHLVDSSTGTGLVLVDGVACASFLNTYPNYVGSHNGQYNTVAALRCPVAAGTHTVSVSLTAGSHIGFEGLGTPAVPPASAAPPRMYAWGPLHQNNDTSATATFLYAKTLEDLVAQMAADGYLVEYVNVRDHVIYNGTADPNSTGAAGASCMANQLHPSNCGHAQIAAILESSIPKK